MVFRYLDNTLPKTDKPRVVIVGAGFAGINLAKRIDTRRFQTVLLDRNNHHVFQPLLYQTATAGLEPEAICSPVRKILSGRRDTHFRMVQVRRVDPARQRLETDAGELRYDYLVIAVGAKTHYFGNPDFERETFPLKDIGDAVDLRNHLFSVMERAMLSADTAERDALTHVVVVGGGPTGVEVVGALAELRRHVLVKDYPELSPEKFQITLVEGMERLLTGMSETAAKDAASHLKRMQVDIRLGTRLIRYDGERLQLDDGAVLHTRTVIWAAGVKPALLEGFPERSVEKGRYAVNAVNQVRAEGPGQFYDNVFAVGDISLMRTDAHPDGLPGMAPAAIQQGRHLAANLKRLHDGRPLKPFRYRDKGTMATIGRNCAVAELNRSFVLSGFFGWITWMAVHLWYLIGFRNKIVVAIDWMWNYFTYDRGARAIVRPTDTALHRGSTSRKDDTPARSGAV